MLERARERLTFSNVVACVALFAALGGTSYAAVKLPKNSVTTTQVKDKSLMARDFKRGQLPAGEDGLDGTPGPAGPQGPAGVTAFEEALGPEVPTGPSGSGSNVRSSYAACPAGTAVSGGGFHGGVRTFIADAYKSGNGYNVIAVNNGSLAESVQAQAFCARGPGVTASKRKLADAAAERRARLAEVRARVAR
jgi:hypothetical protein